MDTDKTDVALDEVIRASNRAQKAAHELTRCIAGLDFTGADFWAGRAGSEANKATYIFEIVKTTRDEANAAECAQEVSDQTGYAVAYADMAIEAAADRGKTATDELRKAIKEGNDAAAAVTQAADALNCLL